MLVRKKPIVVEAMRLTPENVEEVGEWCSAKKCTSKGYESYLWGYALPINDRTIYLRTLEGEMYAQMGDWIIKGVKGEFYPCKPDIFEMTYDIIGVNNMNREEVIRLAKKAGIDEWFGTDHPEFLNALDLFATLVAGSERAACADVCDELASRYHMGLSHERLACLECGASIRQRTYPKGTA